MILTLMKEKLVVGNETFETINSLTHKSKKLLLLYSYK